MTQQHTDALNAVIALDVGGTAIKSGLVRTDNKVERLDRVPVPADGSADAVFDALAAPVQRLRPFAPDAPVAIAIPAPFDYEHGISLMEHKFASIHGQSVAHALRERLGPIETRFANDADAAGAGEVAALPLPHPLRVLVVTLGTGLGAALIVDGSACPGVGDLWQTPFRGSLADGQFSATGLARTLGVSADELPAAVQRPAAGPTLDAWGESFASLLQPVVDAHQVDALIVAGGAAGAFHTFAAGLSRGLSVPCQRGAAGSSGPLVGAARLLFP